ncbi:hypothetical protein [Nocardia sp. NPDC003979]
MATGVGLRIADDECVAAVVTDDGAKHFVERSSVLHMSDDGDAALGDAPLSGKAHAISGFVRAIGDPAGVDVDGGEAYRAEDLLATAMFCLIDLTTEHLSGPAEFYATHPAQWSPEVVRGVREALDYLGLKSVALLGEDELPQPAEGADPGKAFASSAAEAALVAVLATPAGATPPDPIVTENSLVKTDVMPAVEPPVVVAQAYSAALPVQHPTKAMAVTVPAPAPTAPAPAPVRNKTPLLIAGAALIGLVLGGIAVSVLLRGTEPTEPPTISDAHSETTQQPAPTPVVAPPPPEPTTEEPVVTTTPEPTTTTEEPTTTEAPTTTTPTPTTTTPTTTPGRTTTTRPFPFQPREPGELPPPLEIPGWRKTEAGSG